MSFSGDTPYNSTFQYDLTSFPKLMMNAAQGGAGILQDLHETHGPLGFYDAEYTGSQTYKWKCQNIDGNALHDMTGNNAGPHSIVRSESNLVFSITKHGVQAYCSLDNNGWCQ